MCFGIFYMLNSDDGHVLRIALEFGVQGQKKKIRLKLTWKKQVDEESMKVGLNWKDIILRQNFIV